MQVYTVASRHIVSVSRIDEVVRVRTGIDAGTEEGDAVLRHTHRVVGTDDDLQLALQVTGPLGEVGVSVTFRVVLRGVHIAFAVHHFIQFPVDDRSAGYRAVSHLIGTGCRRIGMINCAYRYKYARHRKEGYLQALKEAGLSFDPSLYVSIPAIDYTLAYSAAMQVMCTMPPPDALFACSDVLAAAAVNAAHSRGIRIPDELSVIGFDNVETSKMTLPPLTTIAQPSRQLGQQACSILLERIQNPRLPHRQILLSTEMVIRGSTK